MIMGGRYSACRTTTISSLKLMWGIGRVFYTSTYVSTSHSLCGKLLLRLLPNTGRPICISIGIWWGDIGFSGSYVTGNFRGYPKAPSTPLLLSSLFLLSDPWHSSHSPSHRPSTSTLHDLSPPLLSVSLVDNTGVVELCRWLAGSIQRIHTPYF